MAAETATNQTLTLKSNISLQRRPSSRTEVGAGAPCRGPNHPELSSWSSHLREPEAAELVFESNEAVASRSKVLEMMLRIGRPLNRKCRRSVQSCKDLGPSGFPDNRDAEIEVGGLRGENS